jgi:hypothetical protein
MKAKLLLLTISLISLNTYSQSTITVDNSVGSNAQYSDLQSAISAASSGDIIYVHASEINYGDIDIDKSITLIGFSHSDPDKKTLIDEIDLLDNASNTTISGFMVTNFLDVSNPTTPLTNIIIENNYIDGILYFPESLQGVNGMTIRGNILDQVGTSTVWSNFTNTIITNNIFIDRLYVKYHESVTVKNNIFLNGVGVHNLDDASGDLEVQDCIFYDNHGSTRDINNDGVVYQNCLTYNLGSGSYTTLTGAGNLNNQNPLFVSATDDIFDVTDDYHLQGGSPAIGAGVSGGDLGIFNTGAFVFNNFGLTNNIPTVKISAITETVQEGETITVTINTNAN